MTDYLTRLERDLKQMQERPTYKNTMQQVWKDKDILTTALDTILPVFLSLVAEHEAGTTLFIADTHKSKKDRATARLEWNKKACLVNEYLDAMGKDHD